MYKTIASIVLTHALLSFAVPVHMELEGTITSKVNNPAIGEGIPVGTPFSGCLKYDTDFVDSSASGSDWTNYYMSQYSEYSITVGDYEFESEDILCIVSHPEDQIHDTIYVYGLSNTLHEGIDWFIGLTFVNSFEHVLTSTALPTTPIDLESWPYAVMDIKDVTTPSGPGNPAPSLTGRLSSITPEPATVAILMLGGLAVLRRR